MTVIRPNSITGINSITAQGSTVEFYNPDGDTITIQANVSGNLEVVSGILTATTVDATTVKVGTGVTISAGVITATSFSGDGSSLTGIDATSLKDSGGNVKVQANSSGAVVSGMITVGDSFINSTAIGIGTTTTAGRDAGIGTAPGTIIYNSTAGEIQAYTFYNGWKQVGTINDTPPIPETFGHTATGGLINDYTDPGPGLHYRTHVFTGSGTFQITQLGADFPAHVDYLVVGAGGGGGQGAPGSGSGGAGGGAGGLRTSAGPSGGGASAESALPVTATSYPVVIGAGGVCAPPGNEPKISTNGGDSTFATITSTGGGSGGPGHYPGGLVSGGAGGSGGGTSYTGTSFPLSGGAGTANQGYPGGNVPTTTGGGGGGGAGAAGDPGTNPGPAPYSGGNGGDGVQSSITGTATYYAGGGGGANINTLGLSGNGGNGGGGDGGGRTISQGPPVSASSGLEGKYGENFTGGGGGGGSRGDSYPPQGRQGGYGGSGVVVVRYQIGTGQTAGVAKATGGLISFNAGKTIHTFISSGTFSIPAPVGPLACDYLLVGGGAGGGNNNGGAGGGGGVVFGPALNIATGSYPVVIGGGSSGRNTSPADRNPAPMHNDGTPTTFNSMTAGGGGRGGNFNNDPAGNTGSPSTGTTGGTAYGGGGGGGDYTSAGSPGGPASGATTNTQGGAGGGSYGSGGGAGGAGTDSSGGVGVENSILGTPYYWGGGGGGVRGDGTAAPDGGNGGGGGGAGGSSSPGGSGGAGLNPGTDGSDAPGSGHNSIGGNGGLGTGGGGAGGGAGGDGGTNNRGGNGGSGIVIVAYPT